MIPKSWVSLSRGEGLPQWLSGPRRPGFDPWAENVTWRKGMATCSSILAWRILWTKEPGGLQFMGTQRVLHDWATHTQQRRSGWFWQQDFLLSFPHYTCSLGGAAISRVTDLAAKLWAPRASVGRSKNAHCHSGKSVPGQLLSHATSSRGPRWCQLLGLILNCGLHRMRGGSPIFTSLEFSLTVFL